MRVVLDTSVAISWIFSAERQKPSREILRCVVAEGAVVPAIWRLEVANALRTATRRRRCTEDYASRSLNRLARLPINVDAETDSRAWGDTRQLAITHNLTLYDATYLELAVRLQLPLASLDRALLDAALQIGVPSVPA